jgi:signal transduction histidine kinase
MISTIVTSENLEILESGSNRQVHGGTANGSQLVACSHPNHENDQPSLQKAQQRERLAFLSTSAVVFAHEVGNALQAIFGSLEFIEIELKRREIIDALLMSTLQGATREIDRLRSLLREFRSLTYTQTLKLQRSDLVKIVEEVLALQKLGSQAAGISIKLEYDTPLPLVMLDPAKITQAILNLCKNAVEAMPAGGCLSIRVFLSGSTIVMEIADTGVGLPDDVNPFQLFVTTKPAGSGLGLPVVQQIVSAHKGTISYVTELGRGTTFTVILPAENRN